MVKVKLKIDKKIYGRTYKSGSIVPGIREEVAMRWVRFGKCEIVKENEGTEDEQSTAELSDVSETTESDNNDSDGNDDNMDGD